MRFPVGIILLILVFCVQSFCTYGQVTPDTIYHIVKKSEDINRISSLYNVPRDSIRRWNYLDRNYRVIEGMKLIIRHKRNSNQNNPLSNNPQITDHRQKTKTKLIPEKSLAQLPGTLNSSKKTLKDSLQTSDRKGYLMLFSDPITQDSKSTFFERVLNFYLESGILIKAIIFLNLFFLDRKSV